MITAKVILDTTWYTRITTMEVVLPKCLVAQLNTHRAFSRNSASSRAIPTQRIIDQVRDNPFVPIRPGHNKPGMQAGAPLEGNDLRLFEGEWLEMRWAAIRQAEAWARRGIAKEHVNRLLEPWMWTTVVVTSTEWENFFDQRLNHAAQPEMQTLALAMKDALEGSEPRGHADHCPYADNPYTEPWSNRAVAQSVARCARVSYHRQGQEGGEEELYKKLLASGHWSPFEHSAIAREGRHANFEGWSSTREAFK